MKTKDQQKYDLAITELINDFPRPTQDINDNHHVNILSI